MLTKMNGCIHRRRHKKIYHVNEFTLRSSISSLGRRSNFFHKCEKTFSRCQADISKLCGQSLSMTLWVFTAVAGLPALDHGFVSDWHTWELDAASSIESFGAALLLRATGPKIWLCALSVSGLLHTSNFVMLVTFSTVHVSRPPQNVLLSSFKIVNCVNPVQASDSSRPPSMFH